ncbi:SMODS domain-containing nucleotidyltransferase [Rhizobium rhizogenes]|uniref:SMODS domain-containing nucleotidyltransferase n=1 Tax=Rhizobium rhizogenes TaxID=359 RepID=UPI0015717D56|nr:nucleotidyltransferase [Rhizobium rhizogenes]NTH68489.1 nucleotidyltransferase [Rhizobium rhizogenes]NTI39117.1 nucleotidyltransferase [Rhizobium rhizogenes]WEO70156.1 nucleotidyltransferase [Rhizobium rhizogenes]
MKLADDFKEFLRDTVNLNQTRITQLEERVETIKTFLRASDWEPKISKFLEQGSWAHDTIIRPVDGGEFDADLLVMVKPVDGWSAAQYVKELGRVFRESGRYSDKTQVDDYCVTIIYADDCKIDIAPLVMDRDYQGTLEVCSKREDCFEESSPVEYTRWIREKNGYSGNNSFRKATRLIKYIRDIKKRFSCQSVLLTTLIGHRIEWWDKDSAGFADTPTALQTIMGKLDDWLQDRPEKPQVENPSLPSEDFADLWNETQYANFRNFVNKYRKWIDEAIAAETRTDSIEKWRKVFGDEFAKSENVKKAEASASSQALALLRDGAAHLDALVETVIDFGISILPSSFRTPTHLHRPPWAAAEHISRSVRISAEYRASKHSGRGHPVNPGEALPPRGGLWFDVRVNKFQTVPSDCYVRWRITNTGAVAMALNKGRGWFEKPTEGDRRWEELQYRGVHMAEAFIIRRRDDRLVGYSEPFYVVIK